MTKYDCNPGFQTDHMCLQSFRIWTLYDCNRQNRPEPKWLLFLDASCEKKFSMIAIILGPYWERLQTHMVRLKTGIAIIFSHFWNLDWNYIRSPLWSLLQLYLVPISQVIAIIYCPSLSMKLIYNIYYIINYIKLKTYFVLHIHPQ